MLNRRESIGNAVLWSVFAATAAIPAELRAALRLRLLFLGMAAGVLVVAGVAGTVIQ